jgi:hypothetical protein
MAEVAIPNNLFADIQRMIARLRPPPVASTTQGVRLSPFESMGEVRLDGGRLGSLSRRRRDGKRTKPSPVELKSPGRLLSPTKGNRITAWRRLSGECRFDALG